MSNRIDDKIHKLLSVGADTEIVRQIHGTARDLGVYGQIMNSSVTQCNPCHVLSAACSTQRHPRSKSNKSICSKWERVWHNQSPVVCYMHERKTLDYVGAWFVGHCPDVKTAIEMTVVITWPKYVTQLPMNTRRVRMKALEKVRKWTWSYDYFVKLLYPGYNCKTSCQRFLAKL